MNSTYNDIFSVCNTVISSYIFKAVFSSGDRSYMAVYW